jgi:hypothetical protein
MNIENTPVYSPLFTTIYDEAQPVGNLGRGTHYSILRAAQPLNYLNRRQKEIQAQDLCVVWDEDHDTRVIEVIEELYLQNLLAPIIFIGERKGVVTVLVHIDFRKNDLLFEKFEQQLSHITSSLNDPWTLTIEQYRAPPWERFESTMINANSEKVKTYLDNISNLWDLGLKEYKRPTRLQEKHLPPIHDTGPTFTADNQF